MPILALAVPLAACKTAEDYYGSGPLQLSPRVQAFADRYTKDKHNGYVAVSEDGRYAFAYFCEALACVGGGYAFEAVERCEAKGRGKCWIYGANGFVVWDFEGTRKEASTEGAVGSDPSASSPPRPRSSTQGVGLPDPRDVRARAERLLGRNCRDDFDQHLERVATRKHAVFAYVEKKTLHTYACGAAWNDDSERAAADDAIKECKKAKRNNYWLSDVACKVFAIGHQIVWRGETETSQLPKLFNRSDRYVCIYALKQSSDRWSGGATSRSPEWSSNAEFVDEAKRRGFTAAKYLEIIS